jgi:hypothetical protein
VAKTRRRKRGKRMTSNVARKPQRSRSEHLPPPKTKWTKGLPHLHNLGGGGGVVVVVFF